MGRHGGLKFTALDFGSNGLGSSPELGTGGCVIGRVDTTFCSRVCKWVLVNYCSGGTPRWNRNRDKLRPGSLASNAHVTWVVMEDSVGILNVVSFHHCQTMQVLIPYQIFLLTSYRIIQTKHHWHLYLFVYSLSQVLLTEKWSTIYSDHWKTEKTWTLFVTASITTFQVQQIRSSAGPLI